MSLPAAEGPTFPWSIKLLATVMVVALVVSGAPVLWRDFASWGAGWQLGAAAAAVFVALGYINILISRTGIDGERLYLQALVRKEVRIAHITHLRLVHIPGLQWIIVPRLIVRAGMLRALSFPCADAQVLHAFRQLALGPAHPQ